jgi:hypothetical protein
VLDVRLIDQVLHQVQRRSVEPLQVVEKESQRMLWPGEYTDELPEHELESASCLPGPELRHFGLLSNDEGQLWDEVRDEPAVRAKRLA